MQKGIVKWFSPAKGYGFIAPEVDGADVFLHYTELEKEQKKIIRIGDNVAYDITNGEKGPKALNVKLIDK